MVTRFGDRRTYRLIRDDNVTHLVIFLETYWATASFHRPSTRHLQPSNHPKIELIPGHPDILKPDVQPKTEHRYRFY